SDSLKNSVLTKSACGAVFPCFTSKEFVAKRKRAFLAEGPKLHSLKRWRRLGSRAGSWLELYSKKPRTEALLRWFTALKLNLRDKTRDPLIRESGYAHRTVPHFFRGFEST